MISLKNIYFELNGRRRTNIHRYTYLSKGDEWAKKTPKLTMQVLQLAALDKSTVAV
jgi:hypothetical protein